MKQIYVRLFFSLIAYALLTACEKTESELNNNTQTLSNDNNNASEVDESLIYYYPFNGNSVDLVSGQPLETNGATFGEDRFGTPDGALAMEENFLRLNAGFSDTQGTVSFWINIREFDPVVSLFKKEYDFSSPDYYFLLHDDGSLSTVTYLKWGWAPLEGGGFITQPLRTKPVIKQDKWYHIVLRWADYDRKVEIFVNNKKVLSESYIKSWKRKIFGSEPTATMGKIDIYEGNHEWSYYYLHGRLDDLQRYKCWISNEKIKELYQENKTK